MGVLVGDTKPLSDGQVLRAVRSVSFLNKEWDKLPDAAKREALSILRECEAADAKRMRRILRRMVNRAKVSTARRLGPEKLAYFRWRASLPAKGLDSYVTEDHDRRTALGITDQDESIWTRVKKMWDAKEKF